ATAHVMTARMVNAIPTANTNLDGNNKGPLSDSDALDSSWRGQGKALGDSEGRGHRARLDSHPQGRAKRATDRQTRRREFITLIVGAVAWPLAVIRFRRQRLAREAIMAAKEISVKKYVVRLSGEERERFETLIRKGKSPARCLGSWQRLRRAC